MTIRLKTVALGLGIGLATAAVAQPVRQAPYQDQMPPMAQSAHGMGQMGQAMGQAHPMMNDPRMRDQMAQMAQGCDRMMSMMSDPMRRPEATRR